MWKNGGLCNGKEMKCWIRLRSFVRLRLRFALIREVTESDTPWSTTTRFLHSNAPYRNLHCKTTTGPTSATLNTIAFNSAHASVQVVILDVRRLCHPCRLSRRNKCAIITEYRRIDISVDRRYRFPGSLFWFHVKCYSGIAHNTPKAGQASSWMK